MYIITALISLEFPTHHLTNIPIAEQSLLDFLSPEVRFSDLPSMQLFATENTDPPEEDPKSNSLGTPYPTTLPTIDDQATCTESDWLEANVIPDTENLVFDDAPLHHLPKRPLDDTYKGRLSATKKKAFIAEFLPTRVQLHLENPFGKDNLSQCFYSRPIFRTVFIIMAKSGFLSNSSKCLGAAYPRTVQFLLRRYGSIDFSPLRQPNYTWATETDFVPSRIAMTTAALLYYDGDVASLVRYVGGPHTYADLDVDKILDRLKPILQESTWLDLKRMYKQGCPNKANIDSTAENYQAFRDYGNHPPATEHAAILRKALVKTSKRQLMLMADLKIIDFCIYIHLNPMSVVDWLHRYRKARCITDCSTRPLPFCFAVNDWTSKDDESPLTPTQAIIEHITRVYNLAITFPLIRKAGLRDDISCAFPRFKHHPNVVGMYSTQFEEFWCINTGQTFGENTSPSNFDNAARARKEASQHFWHDPSIIEKAAPYLPPLPASSPLSPDEIDGMTLATADSINTGVLDEYGNRLPPTFSHHVDDNMFCDIASDIIRAASASVIGAYEVFGYPQTPSLGPDAITWDKWLADGSHIDEPVGYGINMHTLTLYFPTAKRKKLASLLQQWLPKKSFQLREAAELSGSLVHASTTNRIAKALFFCLQNAFRRALRTQFFKVSAWFKRSGKEKFISRSLPPVLQKRVHSLVSKSMAAVLWNSRAATPLSPAIRSELCYLYDWLADLSRPWQIPIGHVIPRDRTLGSTGDSSEFAFGAYSHDTCYWYVVYLSADIKRLIASNNIHINALEFVTILIQLAAYITFTDSPTLVAEYTTLHGPLPQEPVLDITTDNQVSEIWTAKVTSKSEAGQNLVRLYCQLLERMPNTKVISSYIPTDRNTTADIISRPDDNFDLTNVSTHLTQIYHQEPRLKLYKTFQPHPTLLSQISSLLRWKQQLTQISLPKTLGQFIPAGSTGAYSVLK